MLVRQPLILVSGSFKTRPVLIPLQTASITLRLWLPTTARPRVWDSTGRLRVGLVLTVDGVEHRCTGQASGGIRRRLDGSEASEYVLTYHPTWGWFGERIGRTRRLGETRKQTYTAHVEIELLSGTVATEIEVTSTESPAPDRPFHSSVAFDAATSVAEFNGDGIVSLTHTSTGANRAVFAGVGGSHDVAPVTSASTTYGGTAMTEMWDLVIGDNFSGAGYRLAGQATGAQTVTNTMDAVPNNHFLGVISMTGVDQVTPVGTPVTSTGQAASYNVTVAGVGVDDLVVDHVACGWASVTTGADQTQRYTEGAGFLLVAGSTQLGSAGGVMSGSDPGGGFSADFAVGAVAFKPAAVTGRVLVAPYSPA